MSSFDTPPQPSTEQPRIPDADARTERFLEREDLHHLNSALSKVFTYFDAHEGELINDEADAARKQGSLALAFRSRFELMLPKEDPTFSDYQTFLDLLDNEAERPKLLSKMCYMSPGETEQEQKDSWPDRQAFSRFLYEFYGTEKEHFLSLEVQTDLVEAWSMKGDWGFTKEDFQKIRKQIPDVRTRFTQIEQEEEDEKERKLIIPVLTPSPPDNDGMKGEHRTFAALRTLLTVPQGKNFINPVYAKPTKQNLQLHGGREHESGLKFEILGLGDNQGESPDDVRSKDKNVSGAGVLAAAALSPEWVQAMNGGDVPYAWAAGYKISVPGEEPWRSVPDVHFDRGARKVGFSADWDDHALGRWSVPSPRE